MKLIGRLQIILGIWILISPWVLDYAGLEPALWSGVVSGAAVALLGLWSIFGETPES